MSGAAANETRAGPTPPEVAWDAIARYRVSAGARPTFIRHGENTTYRVDDRERSMSLRFARPGYQSAESIRSEIAWMAALREEGIATPAPVPGRDGDVLQEIALRDGSVQLVVAFEWVEGTPLPAVAAVDAWHRLGEMMARIHEHGRRWRPPDAFTRPPWDLDALVGDEPRWGPPCPVGVWPETERRAILAARDAIRERLARFGADSGRFGLIHSDLGFENVLVRRDGTAVVIDFDDSGAGWFLYELASALYPLEGTTGFDERRDALVTGYRAVRALADEDLDELTTFLMCRRLATLGWTFSRAETPHAQRQRSTRLRTSPPAAIRFLEWHTARESRVAFA